MADDLLQAPAWTALQRHAEALSGTHLRDLLDQPGRFEAFSRQHGSCLLDFSRNRLTTDTLELLVALAGERELPRRIQALFAGEVVNPTENRPAQHMALRGPESPPLLVNGADIRVEIAAERERMLALADTIRSGEFRGSTGARIRHVVNIGIGGSDLGLVMASEALREFCTPEVRLHYVSNVDGTQLADVLATVPAAETLFIICSKTFVTWETALNANAARTWFLGQLGEAAVARHFVAVSVNAPAMDRFGIAEAHRFRMWDWVGGRYSLWSSIGLAIAIAIGSDHFRDLLAGGHELDEHFRTAPLADNLPVLLGLIAVWNQNLQGTTSQAILPYDARLHRFPAYLQQLEMESNGKGVTRDGQPVRWATGTVHLGRAGQQCPALVLPAPPPGHGELRRRFHRARRGLEPLRGPAPGRPREPAGPGRGLCPGLHAGGGPGRAGGEGQEPPTRWRAWRPTRSILATTPATCCCSGASTRAASAS